MKRTLLYLILTLVSQNIVGQVRKEMVNLNVDIYEFTDTLIRNSIEHQLIDSQLNDGCSFCLVYFGDKEDRKNDILSFEFDSIPYLSGIIPAGCFIIRNITFFLCDYLPPFLKPTAEYKVISYQRRYLTLDKSDTIELDLGGRDDCPVYRLKYEDERLILLSHHGHPQPLGNPKQCP